MNYLQIDKASINNGPGVRVVLWVSGCTLHCKGCQNPESWNFNAGKLFDLAAKQELFDALSKPYISGITFSGGHPLERENIAAIHNLITRIRVGFPEKDIWLYTGWELTIDNFTGKKDTCYNVEFGQDSFICSRSALLSMCDVIVDGPYIEEQRDVTLKFRGSANQRLINVKETLEQGKIITIQN